MRRVLARLPKGIFATRDNVAGKNQSLEGFHRFLSIQLCPALVNINYLRPGPRRSVLKVIASLKQYG